MLVISSREFRQNQRHYFDRVDAGEQVVVQRGRDKAYRLEPVTEDDVYFTPAMVEKIKGSYERYTRDGAAVTLTTSEEIRAFLGL